MTAVRIAREAFVLVGAVAIALALLVLVVYGVFAELEPGELGTVVGEFVFGFAGPALAIFTILVALGATLLRRRGPWWRIGAHALSAIVAGIANVAIVVAIGEASDAQGGFVGALGLLGSVLFVPLALLAAPIVVLLLDRGRSAAAPTPTSDPAAVP